MANNISAVLQLGTALAPFVILVATRIAVGKACNTMRSALDSPAAERPGTFSEIDTFEARYYWRIFGSTALVEFIGLCIVWNAVSATQTGATAFSLPADYGIIRLFAILLALMATAPIAADAFRRGKTDTLLSTAEEP